MSILGNIIWFVLGGAVTGLLWCFSGVIWSITLIGIPVGQQCFKIARLCFFPFGKTVENAGRTGSFLLNLLWVCFSGWTLAVEAIVYCLTIAGIPFGNIISRLHKCHCLAQQSNGDLS